MSESFPPPDFVLTETAVSGITVYKPKPPDEHDLVRDFHCPNCTATTAYSTDDGGLTCASCGYHDVPQAKQVGKKAEEFEFTVEALQQSVHGWGEERKELLCNNCVSQTTLPVASLTHTCPFCGSNKVVQSKAAQDVLRPRYIVPFAITTDQCRQTVSQWGHGNWMLIDLSQKGRGLEFVPIYLPFWTFDARAYAKWEAKQRSEGKVVKKSKGSVQLFFDDLLVFGSKHVNQTLLNQIRKFDLEKLVDYSPEFLAGIQAQAYEVPLEEAWAEARHRMRLHTKKESESRVKHPVHEFKMDIDFQDESWRYVLLPLYVAVLPYGKDRHQILVNGQTGEIAGQRPVDWRRIFRWMMTLVLPAVFLGMLSLILVANGLSSGVFQYAQPFFVLCVIYLVFTAVYLIDLMIKASKIQSGEQGK